VRFPGVAIAGLGVGGFGLRGAVVQTETDVDAERTSAVG
jgi:hypothetical protein